MGCDNYSSKRMNAISSDDLLASACAAGDADAFERIAKRYGAALDAFFRRRLPDDGRVEELRQETLLAVHRLLPGYRERGKFRSLVFSIAYRQLVSELRRRPRTVPLDDRVPAHQADPDRFEIHEAIRALPETLREAILLTRFEGFPAAEAGQLLGCSAEAVRARVCRAVSLLARRFHPPARRKP
jgi:RNA polymerase sigma factor (sigma-70 family)